MTTNPVLILLAGTTEVPSEDPAYEGEMDDVPALFLQGVDEPIWIAPSGTYWDRWGDGSVGVLEVVADHLRKVLNP